jgi:putative flippase GtrA
MRAKPGCSIYTHSRTALCQSGARTGAARLESPDGARDGAHVFHLRPGPILSSMFNQFLRFLIVGGLAAAADILIAVAALESINLLTEYELDPWLKLAINLGGVVCASVVAYVGLRRWVFTSSQPHRAALPRFLAMTLGAVIANELALLGLLSITPLSYQHALALTLVATAVLVFEIARRWVFQAR